MGKEIIWSSLGWTESDDFIAFAFGDFVSSNQGIIRTSDGDRYNINLSAPMQDKTAEVPGGDGQYYFGTYHKPKVFDISFAFEHLEPIQLQKLKQTFAGKEMRELVFSEERDRIYMAKVTGQPNIKALCFDETYTRTSGEGEGAVTTTHTREIYKGEGSVQFTAYWPYAREATKQTASTSNEDDSTTTTISEVQNSGDIPTFFDFEVTGEGANVSKIEIKNKDSGKTLCLIQGENITSWNSKTGIIKSGDNTISYTGNGLFLIPPVLQEKIEVSVTHAKKTARELVFTMSFYNWYY